MNEQYTFQTAQGIFDLRTCEGKNAIDVGSLEKEAFDYLGEWNYDKEKNYAYRLGIKKNFPDSEGDPATLFILFPAEMVLKGAEHDYERMEKSAQQALEALVLMQSQAEKNVMGTYLRPPEYMIKELEEIIK